MYLGSQFHWIQENLDPYYHSKNNSETPGIIYDMFITNILIISLKPEFYSLSQNMFLYHVAFAFFDSATYISNYRTRGQVLEKPADIWPSLLWNLAELWSNLVVHIVNMFSFQVKVPVFSDISYWHGEHESERSRFHLT